MANIALIDSSTSSLTVSWPALPGAKRYHLQYRPSRGGTSSGNAASGGGGRSGNDAATAAAEYSTLSDKLSSTQARKKNLDFVDGPFFFRVRAIGGDNDSPSDSDAADGGEWVSHDDGFQVVNPGAVRWRIDGSPRVESQGGGSALVRWDAFVQDEDEEGGAPQLSGYELQMRPNSSGAPWRTVAACVKNPEARKRNLDGDGDGSLTYQFRVRPVLSPSPFGEDDESDAIPFSPPSDFVSGRLSLSPGMRRLFAGLSGDQLVATGGGGRTASVSLEDSLAGKVVLLYASAHWCGPCRQFTPKLAEFYAAHRADVEVVFLSCDHDEGGFDSYFATMPWKAVPYDCDVRERLLSWIRVTGIPRLVVLNGAGGILVDNAVGKPMDVARWKREQ